MLEPRSLMDVLQQQQHVDRNGPNIDIELSEESEMECSAALIFEDNINPAEIFGDISNSNYNSNETKPSNSNIDAVIMTKLKSLEALNSTITIELENCKVDQSNKATQIQRLLREDKEKENEIIKLRLELKEQLQSQSIISSSQSSRKDSLQEELIKITTEFHELQNLNHELEKKNQIFSIESQKLKSDINLLVEEAKGCKMELSKVTIELNQSRAETDILKSEKEELCKQKTITDHAKSQLEIRLREHEMDKIKLEEQLKGLFHDFNNKCSILNRANDEIVTIDRRMTHLDAENSNLKYKLNSIEMIERDFSNAKRHIASLEAELNDNIMEINRLRSSASGNNLDLGHIAFTSRPSYSRVASYSSYSDPAPEQYLQDSTIPSPPTAFLQQPQIRSDQVKASIEHATARLDQVKISSNQQTKSPNFSIDTSAVKNNLTTGSNVNTDENNEVIHTNQRTSSRQSIGSLLQNKIYKPNYEEVKPLNSMEATVNSASINNNQSISSNGTPFATEQSAAEISKVYAEIDKKLTYLMTERTALHEECEKLHQRGGKTLRERTRLTEVELRLGELNKEISLTRKSLTSKPS